MTLSWPWALVALAAFPLLLAYRWWTSRRRRRGALRVSSIALIRAALPDRTPWRRRIPLVLFAVGLVVLGVGAARPQASVLVPSDAASIVLAIDQSGSMCSTDVPPNRLTAAENAARDFVRAQDDGTRIGLVVFSGIAALQVPPTTEKDQLLRAIDGLRTARGTAIGLGILTAVDAIAEINPNVAASGVDLPAGPATGEVDYEPDAIVVLTDGANTQGVDPVTAARQAAARHLRVYTIGFGTTQPAPFVCRPDQINGDSFGNGRYGGFGGGFGGRGNQGIDETALTQVATITGGKYFQAKDSRELTRTLLDLPSTINLERRKVEVSVWFVLAGAALVALALSLSSRRGT